MSTFSTPLVLIPFFIDFLHSKLVILTSFFTEFLHLQSQHTLWISSRMHVPPIPFLKAITQSRIFNFVFLKINSNSCLIEKAKTFSSSVWIKCLAPCMLTNKFSFVGSRALACHFLMCHSRKILYHAPDPLLRTL